MLLSRAVVTQHTNMSGLPQSGPTSPLRLSDNPHWLQGFPHHGFYTHYILLARVLLHYKRYINAATPTIPA